jgi:hypothetical protein
MNGAEHMAEQEDIIVNMADDVFHPSRDHDPPRKVSEYKPTNMPLSKFEIEQDEAKGTAHHGWTPRTLENIGDMVPLPEKPGPACDID